MIHKLKYLVFSLGLLLTAFLAQRCANAVAPTGGPKDTTPPVVVAAVPENQSTHFIGKKIEITFDEFITLENANQNVMISPPLKEKLDIKLKNKTVVVKFKENLVPNTTYTINFGSAIKDLHEGNPFKDYVYSFSTGDHIDTLSITGKVVDAETIFALKDANANLYFDLANEASAFLDMLVTPSDSTLKPITLRMFTEVDSTQVLLEKKLIEEGLLRFVFRHPAKDAVIMTPEMLPDTFNLVTTHSAAYDTVWWYFTPNVKDSLWVQVKYDTVINDSSRYSLKFKDKKGRNKKPEPLKVKNNLIGRGALVHDDTLTLTFSEPIVRYAMRDSAVFKCDTLVFYDTLAFEPADEQGMKYRLVNPVAADVSYHIEIPDSVFFGIRNRTNEAIKLDFHVVNDDEYGNIYITVMPPKGMKQVVVQLTNESGKVVKEQVITKNSEVMFDYLMPAKYKLRAILDADGNGKWSTGNYHRHTLPETIIDYINVLDLKAGWDIDLSDPWEL